LSGRRRIVGFVIVVSMIACNAVLGIDHYRDCAGMECGDSSVDSGFDTTPSDAEAGAPETGLGDAESGVPDTGVCSGQCSTKSCADGGLDCLGGACISDMCQPVVLANNETWASYVAVDGTNVYWTDGASGGGFVRAMPRGGGTPVTLTQGGSNEQFYAIAVYSGTVFYSEINKDHLVYAVPIDGGTAVPIASVKYASDLGIDGTGVYMVDTSGTVYATSFDGGALRTVASAGSTSFALALGNGFVYWGGWHGSDGGGPGAVWSAPASATDAAPFVVATNQTPVGIAVSTTTAYWVNQFGGTGVASTALPGGGTVTTFGGPVNGSRIALDCCNVYWTDYASGTVSKAPLGGGSATIIASNQFKPSGIAVDDVAVYWANQNGDAGVFSPGSIMRLAK
jgi:hypothetical protein